ncbi:PIN domain-containing protein [Niabella ginsengisoli]|uniref:PIN domain-containing protein n=1 Tax=Niabella ginsengisoli TaxID=522298 RepID=A0ABS9SLQ3_9BACT|nr:PIN domain-containing protein [Niabella ginsengisoli]MCH5599089.1 PIN domain-containing protein [Niabella ginsengisoli]
MNGNKLLLDTNALIGYLQGDIALEKMVTSSEILIPVISIIEFLAFNKIEDRDRKLLYDFASEVQVVDLKKDDINLIELISNIRITHKTKLPDAIIAGMAIYSKATLVTNDKGFDKIKNLSLLTF